jgi:ferric enterobactin receptor
LKQLFLFILTLTFIHSQSLAQRPGGGGPPGGGVPTNAHVFGKIIDEKSNSVGFASVIILKQEGPKATLFTGTNSSDNGEFSLENVPMNGKYKLQVSYLGYEILEQNLTFLPGKSEYDLAKIVLKEDAQKLSEVTVSATVAGMKMDIDKKVFNVAALSTIAGGTGEDVLKSVPSVNVDIEGNISLRNASPTFLVDGRPTLLTPDQIPADAIESIEVLTNPSAKFDASGGTGGIINIVLKKNKKSGYNGSLRGGIESNGALNGGIDFNFRQNKINLSLSSNLRGNKSNTDGEIVRNLSNNGTVFNKINQKLTDISDGSFNSHKIGIDYLVTNKTTLSASINYFVGIFNPSTSQSFSDDFLNDNLPATNSLRTSDSDRKFENFGYVLGFKKLLDTEGDEWTIDFNVNKRIFSGDISIATQFYKDAFGSPILREELQSIENSLNN